MVKLNDIHHTATFAWSNDTIPILATGTSAGVIDDDFSSSSSLSFYSLDGRKPLLSVDADAKFHDLDWSLNNSLIAGALENGTVQFWNTEKLHSDNKVTAIAKGTKHSGPIKSLQFNPIQKQVLASGGANGEIFVWDTVKINALEPFAPGAAMTPMDTVTSVAWNKTVAHIFAAAGSAGYTSIWDLKSKKEVLHLTYTSPSGSRATLSTVAWHPTQSTKLITASETDGAPLLLTWDLRNSNAPEAVLSGHKKGILSLDWNPKDPTLLLSCGKDNTTVLWNPITAEKLAQYPTTANWAFKTRFAPQAPDVFATSSFDKKVVIQTLQDTSPPVNKRINSTTDNDFWNEISTTETQQPEYFVKQAPNWYGRKSSVGFGFGGKIVTVSRTGDKTSEVQVKKALLPGSSSNEKLSTALNSHDFKAIIEERLEKSYEGINKSDWELLKESDGSSDIFEKFIALKLTEEPPATQGSDRSGEDFFTDLNEHPKFSPTGEFKFAKESQKLTEALLTKNLSKAVDISLKEDMLVEALVIALNGPQELKDKVANYYFNKNAAKDFTARLLFSTTANDVSDLVENGDVASWKEIGTAIKTYATSPEVLKTQFSRLGDRLLADDPVKNRGNSIATYVNASALDKVAEIWISELKTLEKKILDTEKTSAYDAHFASLSEFVEKFSAYRSTLNLDAPISESSSTLSTILEYINIISTNGQFDLAAKLLYLLPSDVPAVKLEQDRINNATGSTSKSSARKVQGSTTAASRYGSLTAQIPATTGYSGLPPASQIQTHVPRAPVSSNPYLPNAGITPAVPSYGYTPAEAKSPYAHKTPLYGPPTAAVPSNPYLPASTATPMAQTAIPPPPRARKNETDGWNDLPTHFHHPPTRRATPAAAAVVSPAPTNGLPPQQPGLSRNASFASQPTMPPPPRSVSRSRKTPTLAEAKPAIPAQPQVSSRYAPASPQPNISALNNLGIGNGFPAPQQPLTSSPAAAPKNPYAPSVGSTPLMAPGASTYAPPPTQTPVAVPSTNAFAPAKGTPAPPAPSNPYAPPPSTSNTYAPNQVTPTPAYGAAPPHSNFEVPPPQKLGAHPQHNFVPPPAPSAPPKGPAKQGLAAQPPAVPEKEKYPAGDRSHIPADQVSIYQALDTEFKRVAPEMPQNFSKQVADTEKRLNFLFDHLNNQDLLTPPTVELLKQLCSALLSKDYSQAMAFHLEIMTSHADEVGHWAVGVKRLIQFSEAGN